MSQLQGARAESSPVVFEDAEERRVLFAALDSFRRYRQIAHFNVTHRRRQAFYALPQAEWTLLSAPPFNFLETLDRVDDAIDANADIAVQILEAGLDMFGLERVSQYDAADWHGTATPTDLDKARSTIRQLYRDWSAEGAGERDASYGPVLQAVRDAFANRPGKGQIKLLVPGAGLGRLVLELAEQGYNVEGNEISHHQLLASNWILNHTEEARQRSLYPFAFDFSNVVSRTHQLKKVEIPDINVVTALKGSKPPSTENPLERMNMTAGDFVELYGDPDANSKFSAVITVFFLDTAANVIRYIEAIRNCLQPGGIWINNGPLLWHWSDQGPANQGRTGEQHSNRDSAAVFDHGHIELSVEEILILVGSMGFEVDDKGVLPGDSGYIQNPSSMLRNEYTLSHWVARKTP